MKAPREPSDPCPCWSGLTYGGCCGDRNLTLLESEESFDAAAVYRAERAFLLDLGVSPSFAALHASAMTVSMYLEGRRGDPRFRRYFKFRQVYENLLSSSTREKDEVPPWMVTHAPFDLRASPSRRAAASFFLETHGAALPDEAAAAVRAQLRARDDYAKVEPEGGRLFLERLRDGRRLPFREEIELGTDWFFGRIVDFAGEFHCMGGGPSTAEAAKKWREIGDYAARWYGRRDRMMPPHTHPGKVTIFASFILQTLERFRSSDTEVRLDPREKRRLRAEMYADPELRRIEVEGRRWISRQWCETPQPELGNRTPRSLAGTRRGKEQLRHLLKRWETNPFQGAFRPSLRVIRRSLGLSKPPTKRKGGRPVQHPIS